MTTNTATQFPPTTAELAAIKRKITEAGKLQDQITPLEEKLEALKKEIKSFETRMTTSPKLTVSLVSGQYVATLSAERQQREITEDTNRKLLHRVGLERFMDLVKMQTDAVKKAIGEAGLEAIAPAHYTGKGRSLKITKRQ